MWQPSWPDYTGNSTNKPPGMPGDNGVDWGAAAQQWIKNKEFYEQWQQQQYQQHLQMMAATHAAQMAQCIDPSVINNPPPPPPLPTDGDSASTSKHLKESKISEELNKKNESSTDINGTQVSNSNNTETTSSNSDGKNSSTVAKIKNPLNSNSANSKGNSVSPAKQQRPPFIGKDNLYKPSSSLFAAYDQTHSKNTPSGSLSDTDNQNYEKYLSQNYGDIGSSDSNEKSHKQLPLWLREGLEKIKQEKQKKQNEVEKKTETKPTISSVFTNDDDDDEESEEEVKMSKKEISRQQQLNSKQEEKLDLNKPSSLRKSSSKFADPPKVNNQIVSSGGSVQKFESTIKPELSNDEKKELMMSLVKSWMTEILLDVTNSEMQTVAKEVYQFQKEINQKQQIKKTKASLNISYGDDDDDDDDDDSDNEKNNEEDIEFLKKRGEQKRADYEKKILAEHINDSSTENEKQKGSEEERKISKQSRKSRSRSRTRSRSRSRSPNSRRKQSSKKSRRSRTKSRSRSNTRKDRERRRRRSRSRSNSSSSSRSHRKRRNRSRTRSRSKSRSRSRSRSYTRSKHSSKSSKRNKRDRSRSRSNKKSRRKSRSTSSSSTSSSRSKSPKQKSKISETSSPLKSLSKKSKGSK